MGFDLNKPNGSRAVTQGDLLTQCKICLEGIHSNEPRIWANRILPSLRSGLVHCPCAERTGAQTSGSATIGGQRKYRTGK